MRFDSILVANRGEIAVRVLKSAKALGYRTIAVYSEADDKTPHVALADDAVCIGAPPARESYLVAQKILNAARQKGAQAIHPGYGFLSENANFARACEEAGITFIGPSADAIDLMGNKAAAKRRMIEAEVPCIPGYNSEAQDHPTLIAAAKEIGFPLMIKASAGGGGHGMRFVRRLSELKTAIQSARSEAESAFGSGELILEKAVIRPRHVEIQVFGDRYGNTVHFGERDCSVQRRHQKVIEEAPCPIMTDKLRGTMGKAAVNAAKSINYHGAGTVEFLLDDKSEFFFLEMNTRLQVEHPVTEMITGLDLVALQIKVAQGEPLGLEQNDIEFNGHTIEARLYAEDPTQDFLPVTGKIELWEPASGEGLRVDCGIETGSQISPFYDSMIAKVIAWGPSRDVANARLISALNGSRLFGTKTNKRFLVDILEKETFKNGEATTAFIEEEFSQKEMEGPELTSKEAAIAAVLQYESARNDAVQNSLDINPELLNWGSSGHLTSCYEFSDIDVILTTSAPGTYSAGVGDINHTLSLEHRDKTEALMCIDGHRLKVGYLIPQPGQIHLDLKGQVYNLKNAVAFSAANGDVSGSSHVIAPMHGTLLEILVAVGNKVKKGDRIAVLEAMKMRHDLAADVVGTVTEITGQPGAQIAAGDLLLIIEPDRSDS